MANPDLLLGLYGPGEDGIKKSHHDKPADDPYYIWSGTCTGNWAVEPAAQRPPPVRPDRPRQDPLAQQAGRLPATAHRR